MDEQDTSKFKIIRAKDGKGLMEAKCMTVAPWGDTAREDSVGYLTRTSGSRRGRQSAMAAQLELSQVGPRRSLKLRAANNRPTPSLPFPSPGCASRLGR